MTADNHQVKAFSLSVGVYVLLLSLLIFLKISYTPEEDIPAFGVDLNYGVDLKGHGDLQTLNKANDSKVAEEMAPSGNEETQPKVTPQTKPTPPAPKPTPKTQTKTAPAKKVLTSDIEKTPVKTPQKTSNKPSSPASTPTQTKTTTTPAAPPRSVDEGSILKKRGTAGNSNGTVGTKTGIGGNNNGDGKPGDVGDQGSPQGTLDGKSLYGKPGSGGTGGASVSISGWKKKSISLPKDNSNETGRIVFNVSVNDLGVVTRINSVSSTVSPSVVKFYENYLKRNLSSFLIPEGTPPANSNGQITIIIKSGN